MGFTDFYETLSPEELNFINNKNIEDTQRQLKLFKKSYAKGECYICNKKLTYFSEKNSCIHTILLAGDIKKGLYKKLFNSVVSRFSYHNISAMVRRVANSEGRQNINDLKEEAPKSKFFEYTIKYKTKEFTFSCSDSDIVGHKNTNHIYPHWHFQIRNNGFPYFNFNDAHIKFHDYDMFIFEGIESGKYIGEWGFGGAGPQEHLDLIDKSISSGIDPSEYLTRSETGDGHIRVQTFITAKDGLIKGELIDEALEESKKTGKTINTVLKEKFSDRLNISTGYAPPDDIPDISGRSQRN